MYIYIYIYKKSKKTTSYFHRTFRIALNSFSTLKSLNSATAFTKKLKTDLQGVIKSHFILDIGIRRLSITLTKMLCDVIRKAKSKAQDRYMKKHN